MTPARVVERVLSSLAGTAVAVILVALVFAAFTLPSRPAVMPAAEHGPIVTSALLVPGEERAEPIARGERIRDEAPVDVAPAAAHPAVLSAPEPVEEALEPAATAEPTPEPTPQPTPKPTPRPTAPPPARTAAPPVITTSTQESELRMLALINASRTAGGLVPLVPDATVAAAARSHSQVESQVGYVYHDGPDGTAASRDVPACGTGWYGENTGKIWNGNVDALHIEFMAEPWIPINHRTNIMDPNFRRVGIGAVQGRDALYMTMVFCR